MSPRPPKGTPTDTNLFVLTELAERLAARGPGSIDRVPATEAPHAKRCMAAGLLAVVDRHVVVTDAGHKAIADRKAHLAELAKKWSKS